jgi:hypothetical protein
MPTEVSVIPSYGYGREFTVSFFIIIKFYPSFKNRTRKKKEVLQAFQMFILLQISAFIYCLNIKYLKNKRISSQDLKIFSEKFSKNSNDNTYFLLNRFILKKVAIKFLISKIYLG